ncbi:alpha/beta fold hydrolase [Clostridium bovifaecis]|uniref:Alpha/beta fold hydrolase n=1 Tax=Clostridium bovifaecis TaxID=2184719 RepID=A0A6I6F0X0_9CLOT|nr:alpha/beta fold hydrolase [Clostridium bovifaecis]
MIVIIILTLVGAYFSNLVIRPKKYAYSETYEIEIKYKRIREEEFNKLKKKELYIDSPYGYKLHGFFLPKENSKKFIIICHGFTYSLYGSVKYMDLFIKRDFNVLIYDHRYHGLSGGKNVSFGYYEKYDLKTFADWIIDKFGKDSKIGIMGESMGGGIVLQNVVIDPRIKFCIADCPYSDVTELMKYQLKTQYNLQWLPFLIPLASLFTKIRAGWSFKDVSPIKDLDKVDTPVLFMHGAEDDYVPTYMSWEMYNVKMGMKDIYIAPNAGHVEAYWSNKEDYDKKVGAFLKEIGI